MSTLKFALKKNDFLMDKGTKKLYFVISISLHDVTLREEVDGDDCPLKKMPKHLVNLTMARVTLNAMKVLYGSKDGDIKPSDIPDMPATKTDSVE